MSGKLFFRSEPALLPVVEVIELLAKRHAASNASPGEPPVFKQGAVKHDFLTEGKHGRHSLDVRILVHERAWASHFANAAADSSKPNFLAACDAFGTAKSGGEFVNVAELVPWLREHRVDAVLVLPNQILKRNALVAKHESQWTSIRADLQKSERNGLKEAAAMGDALYYEPGALAWAEQRGKIDRWTCPADLTKVSVTKHKMK